MSIVIGGIRQETNTFCAAPTTLESFRRSSLYRGQEIVQRLRGTRTGEAAFIQTLEEEGFSYCPALTARAGSGGKVLDETFRALQAGLLEQVRRAGTVEGVLLNMHGAMVSESQDDTEGDTLRKLRAMVGDKALIGVSLDGHAHVTQAMLQSADIITGYRTFPHVDEYETARRCAALLVRALRGEIRPVMAWARIPMLLAPHAQSDQEGPMKKAQELLRALEKRPGILDATFFPVQPWLDIPHTACLVLVVADGDRALAQSAANQAAQAVWALREEFTMPSLPPLEAVRRALRRDKGLTILSEASDAPPAGACGDAVYTLRALLQAAPRQPAYLAVVDQGAVQAAKQAGRGQPIHVEVGHHRDGRWGDPVAVDGVVWAVVQDAGYISKMSGIRVSIGDAAVIAIGQIFLVVCSYPFSFIEDGVYRAMGLDMSRARIMQVKSTLHFRAYCRDMADEIIMLDTPGPSTDHFERLPWRRLSRPMWPLDPIQWKPEGP